MNNLIIVEKKIDFYELIDFQDIKSLLSPTSEEERAEYMEGFTPFQDEIDPIVDQWISILEGGAKVFWDNQNKLSTTH